MLRSLFACIVLLLSVFLMVLNQSAYAEMRYQLLSPAGETISLTTINQKRESESLVLYTPEYGNSTRTNPYGVEVIAVPINPGSNQYRVSQVVSVYDCQAQNNLSKCGNGVIPKNGVILSATGGKRDILVSDFKPGATFTLSPLLIYQSQLSIDATNPTAESNPVGSGFPGFRAGNQLVVYTHDYVQPTTGTNEFGYEVTVKNGRVVIQEGADSEIPTDENSFVLSGHGKARQWLLQNGVIGSKIDLLPSGVILSTVDKETYLYQLDEIVRKIEQNRPGTIPAAAQKRIQALKASSVQQQDEIVAKEALALKEELTPILWASYPSVSTTATRAVWHRPSEGSLQEIRQSLDLIQKAGFNTLYLESYLHGDPIFKSTTFETYHISQKLPFQLADSKEDLLKLWLDEAHQRGMKVHVWFQTFYAGNAQYDKTMGSILTAYPDWANIQRSALGKIPLPPSTLEAGSYFLDPANQEAQNFLLTLIDEVITRYPIDGFQLDYIRYPASFPPDRFSYVATTWGYTPAARDMFKERTGIDPATLDPIASAELWNEWNDFKTRQVDRFVRKAHDLIKLKRPELPISVAIFPKPEESLQRKHQNWLAWAQNGWVDYVAPMTLTSSLETIADDTKEVKKLTALPVITGIFGPFNGNSPSDVVDQVWAAFTSGATGIALFDTAHLTQKMVEALHMGLFKSP